MVFKGVYTAVYDYLSQSEGELELREGDVLCILEKSDIDDWWKAKKMASNPEDEEPTGLIPNNYIEEVCPCHPLLFVRCCGRVVAVESRSTEKSNMSDVFS